jgi:hypothetical protein
MSEQPDSVLDEAVRLMDGLRRRVVRGAIRGAVAGPRDSDDVWSKATREDRFDHIATGSAECRVCPICRAIAAARTSGPDVVDYMVDAGESLMAAAREAVSAYERSRRGGATARDAGEHGGTGGGRPADDPRGTGGAGIG